MQKYNITLIFGLVLIGFQWNCQNLIERRFVKWEDIERTDSETVSPCEQYTSYIPDTNYIEHTPIKELRLNFHVMQDDEGNGNFQEAAAKQYIKNLIWVANEKLANNEKMFLPKDNNTPVLPLRYRYRLHPATEEDEGIYFHKNDDLYYMIAKGKNRNNYSRTVCLKYGVGLDSIINIFVMAHHQDSLKSPTYQPKSRGIALGNCVKMLNLYYNTTVEEGNTGVYRTEWHGLRNLNHEIGHALGLRHTWRGDDGCEDTPNHPNCWTPGPGRCKDGSNNVMDYNTFKSAWTPCQIGMIHRNLARAKSRNRRSVIKDWCELDEDYDIVIREEIEWNGSKDLKGNLIVKNGGKLTVRCRVSIPGGGRIQVWPGGELRVEGGLLYNDCGRNWEGIEIISQKGEKGKVSMNQRARIENVIDLKKNTQE